MPYEVPDVNTAQLNRVLGVRALAASVINLTIGASIFVLPGIQARILGQAALIAYALCAVTMLLISLCFAEAGSRVPVSGGAYAYSTVVFGPLVGFLTGTLVYFGGQVLGAAALAAVLLDMLAHAMPPLATLPGRAVSLVLVYACLAILNVRGTRTGVRAVEFSTLCKIVALAAFLMLGAFFVRPENLRWTSAPSVHDIGRSATLLIFAFTGVETAVAPSGEVRNPSHTVPIALLLALAIITVLYMGVQIVTQGIMGSALALDTSAPVAAAASRAFGPIGGKLMQAATAITVIGCLIGDMFASPRFLYAFGRARLIPAAVGRVHPQFRTPYVAIWIHAALVCVFAITGTFERLAIVSAVATLLVYAMCAAAVLRLRHRHIAVAGSPFIAIGGRIVPIGALGVIAWLLSRSTLSELGAIALTLAGACVIYMLGRRGRSATAGAHAAPQLISE